MTCGVNPFFLKVPTGKRKVGVVRLVDNEETRQKMVRHPKNNGERFFEPRDEEARTKSVMDWEWWGLSHSLSDRYDDLMLELLRACKP
jgi:hypothetical protein